MMIINNDNAKNKTILLQLFYPISLRFTKGNP